MKILFVLVLVFFNQLQASDKILPYISEPKVLVGGANGSVTTSLSNLVFLEPNEYTEKNVEFQLNDGTRVGGLFFKHESSSKLLIGTFGFMVDRWNAPAAQFVREYIEKGRVDANVLILDHPTSAPFLILNGSLSFGGYDEARMILEVTEQIVSGEGPGFVLHDYSSIHLIGISMGGNGVANTLVEARRLRKEYYKSAIIFSTAFDLNEVPRRQLTGFDQKKYWGKEDISKYSEKMGMKHIFRGFKRAYRAVKGLSFVNPQVDIGALFYIEFDNRLNHLRSIEKGLNWNPRIMVDSISNYLKSNLIGDYASEIRVPMYVVSSEDDPTVPFYQFEAFQDRAKNNPFITLLGYKHGGHWGYTRAYGPELVENILNNAFNVQ